MSERSMSEKNTLGGNKSEQAEKERLAAQLDWYEKKLPPQYDSQYGQSAGESSAMESRTKFASVSLHNTDRIRILQFPDSVREIIAAAIAAAWPRGIQATSDYYGSYEWKLSGNPWYSGGDDATHSRRLVCAILERLYDHGWVLNVNTNVSKEYWAKDTMIFRHQVPTLQPCDWMSISFSRGDRIRLIDAPQALVTNMISSLGPELQSHEQFRLPGVYELKINGSPWRGSRGNIVKANTILLKLMSGLEVHGFTVYGSVDQRGPVVKDDPSTDSDSWFCCRPKNWSPELPVYHA